MTYSLDIRRLGLMALTLLLVLAVVGPSCLVFASHAFAMPEHAPKKCDSSGNSMDACPHSGQTRVPAVTPEVGVPVEATPAAPISVPQQDGISLALAEEPPGAPVAHLTPLRI